MSDINTTSSLRQRMIEDMVARKLGPHSQRSHIYSCKRFAAYLKRSPETATADDVRSFQRSLIEDGTSIGNRRLIRGTRLTTDGVRLRITRAPVCPALSEFGVYAEPENLP